jgi:hypothetical protein
VNEIVPTFRTAAATASVIAIELTAPAKVVVTPVVGAELAAKVASEVTVVEFGSVRVHVAVPEIADPVLTVIVAFKSAVTVVPTATGAAEVEAGLRFETVDLLNAVAACAGTTDKSPNPSEATATADTFFNEIVFTIFLSFSQIKDDLLSGW